MAGKRAFAEFRDYAADDSPRGTKLTRLHAVDKTGLSSAVVLLIFSALLLANGTCSGAQGVSANFPVCVGGQLSVQAWLAIIGVEFTLTGSFLLPRLLSTAISQSMTSRLVKRGVPLHKLLNSLASAPLLTQVRKGWRKIALARLGIALVVLAATILYKFSFVVVARQDTVLVHADWVEMGDSPWIPGKFCQVSNSWSGDGSVFNDNYRDLVAGVNNSVLYQDTWAANATSGPATLYVGPAINATSVPQLRNGTVSRCVPAVFSKFIFSTVPAPSSWPDASAPFANSIHVDVNFLDAYLFAVGTADGSLNILPFSNSTSAEGGPQYGLNYEFTVTVQIEDCWGNFTWNNAAGYQVFEVQEPVDMYCTRRDMSGFNAGIESGWLGSTSLVYAQAISTAYFAGRRTYTDNEPTFYWDPKRAIELFVLALPINTEPPRPSSMEVSNPTLKAMCDAQATTLNDGPCYYAPSDIAFIKGTIDNHGTGMTILGMALQGFVLLSSLVTLIILLGPRLALLTEWPAQWLGLAVGLPPHDVAAALAGTSRGKNSANSGLDEVFLASVQVEQKVILRLTTARGTLWQGAEHL